MTTAVHPSEPGIEPACPKRMVYGPCGGVRADLSCEMATHRCPFTARPPVEWTANTERSDRRDLAGAMAEAGIGAPASGSGTDALLSIAQTRPVVITDFTVRPYHPRSVADVT